MSLFVHQDGLLDSKCLNSSVITNIYRRKTSDPDPFKEEPLKPRAGRKTVWVSSAVISADLLTWSYIKVYSGSVLMHMTHLSCHIITLCLSENVLICSCFCKIPKENYKSIKQNITKALKRSSAVLHIPTVWTNIFYTVMHKPQVNVSSGGEELHKQVKLIIFNKHWSEDVCSHSAPKSRCGFKWNYCCFTVCISAATSAVMEGQFQPGAVLEGKQGGSRPTPRHSILSPVEPFLWPPLWKWFESTAGSSLR